MSENDNYPQHDKYQCTHCNGTGTIIVFDKLPLENATLDSRDLKGTCRVCKGFGYTFVPNENACYHEYLAKDFKFIEDYRSLGIIYGYQIASCHKCGFVNRLKNETTYANSGNR